MKINNAEDIINVDEINCNECLYEDSCIFEDDKPQTCYYGVLVRNER